MIFNRLFGGRATAPPPRPKPLNNLEDARARHPMDKEVPSPCISLCQMDQASGMCKGCFRTVEEIAAWSRLDEGQRLAVWQRIENHQIDIGQY